MEKQTEHVTSFLHPLSSFRVLPSALLSALRLTATLCNCAPISVHAVSLTNSIAPSSLNKLHTSRNSSIRSDERANLYIVFLLFRSILLYKRVVTRTQDAKDAHEILHIQPAEQEFYASGVKHEASGERESGAMRKKFAHACVCFCFFSFIGHIKINKYKC